MVIRIVRRHIAILLTRDQCVFVSVLLSSMFFGGKGHNHAVAVYNFNRDFLIRNKGQRSTLARLDIQRIGIGIAIGRNDHCNHRIAANVNFDTLFGLLPIYSDRITFHQRLCADSHALNGVKHLIGVLRDRTVKGGGSSLVNNSAVLFPADHGNGGQGGDPLKGNRIILGIDISI